MIRADQVETSPRGHADTSGRARRDASPQVLADASPDVERDTSTPASRDASAAADRDASREYSRDACDWCGEPIPLDARSDAETRWRFRRRLELLEQASQPLRLGVGDPPYPGKAHLYRDHPDYGGEVDHASLLQELDTFDGWVLATSAEALPRVVSLASRYDGWRVAAWVRGGRPGRRAGPVSSWEPVLYKPARAVPHRDQPDDSLVFTSRPRTSDPDRVIGAKPSAWWAWIFRLMGARSGDELVDLFPGSGGGMRAWRESQR